MKHLDVYACVHDIYIFLFLFLLCEYIHAVYSDFLCLHFFVGKTEDDAANNVQALYICMHDFFFRMCICVVVIL